MFTAETQVFNNAIEASDIFFSYREKTPVLKGINLTVGSSSSLAIVGKSGSGKTTLLKIVAGLLKPKRGVVKIFGVDLATNHRREAAKRRIGYIPQQLGLIRTSTVLKNVLVGALWRMNTFATLLGLYPKEEVEYAYRCIDLVGLHHKIHEKVYRLSGGERQRVAIARALMQKPSVILADELTSDLDTVTAEAIVEIMVGVKRQGLTLVMATHDLDLALQHSDRVVCLKDGVKISEMGVGTLSEERIRQMLA